MDLLLVGGTRRFVLAYQVAQRLFIDYWVEDLFDDPVGAIDGSFGDSEEQSRLPTDPSEVLEQRRYHLAFSAHTDAANYLNEKVDKAVDDLLASLPTEGREECIPNGRRMVSQLPRLF